MGKENFVIGVDYGTDSVRTVILDAANGSEIAQSVYFYPRWKKGLYCNAAINQFRQHPLDYVEGLEYTIRQAVENAGSDVAPNIRAISVDTTGSTPVAVDRSGIPLALKPEFDSHPDAMFFLWKDHTAVGEASEINEHAKKFDTNYLQFVGGIYSSEWYWAKLLRALRQDASIHDQLYTWVEHCDWIPFLLTGGTDAGQIKRSRCAAGHKALWSESFGGWPPNEFFATLDPLLDGFTDRMSGFTYTSDTSAGTISAEWAGRLGLPENVLVGVGAFDAHMGAVGGQIEPFVLSKVMGTSTCDMLVAPAEEMDGTLVKGICGQVDGSVIPGMVGLEAGQSAFGDAFAWFRDLLAWPLRNLIPETENGQPQNQAWAQSIEDSILTGLSEAASTLPLHEDDELAVDWMNGRRTPDANQTLKGAITGISLGSNAPKIFHSIVEATCFGARSIVERILANGVAVKGVIGLGGVAKKSPYVMQMMADVLNMPIRVHKSDQTCAAGAAMFAATVANIYPTVHEAMNSMGSGFDTTYYPNEHRVSFYASRYIKYQQLGAFIESQTIQSNERIPTDQGAGI